MWRGALVLGACCLLASGVAAADPVWMPPAIGQGRLGDGTWGVVGEAQILGVAGGYRLSSWPDRELGLTPGDPELVSARIGVFGSVALQTAADGKAVPAHPGDGGIGVGLRIDLAELTRADGPAAADGAAWVGALFDDAWVEWRASRPAALLVGMARIPWGLWRRFDEGDVPFGVPLPTDRLVPDHRFGVALLGDLGAISYTAGVYEDLGAVAPRALGAPPEGRVLGSAWVEWTPRAPMYGSEPPGRIRGGYDPLPTPRQDPWWDRVRVSVGAGGQAVLADAGLGTMLGASLLVKWKNLSLAGEVEQRRDADAASILGASGALFATAGSHLAFTLAGAYDSGAAIDTPTGSGVLAGKAGALWFIRPDRRNFIGILGTLQRGLGERESPADTLLVLLQASF